MPYCQECGAEVGAQQTECQACGAELRTSAGGQEGGPGHGQQNQPAGTGQPQGRRTDQQGSQPQQGDQPRQGQQGHQQPQQGQPRQGGQERARQRQGRGQQGQGGQPPQGGRPPQGAGGPGSPGSDGTSRRQLLMYGGGAVAVLGGGWLAYGQLSGPSGPAGRVKAFVNALDNGNVEKANQMIHSESSQDEVPRFAAQMMKSYDISVKSTKVVEKTESQATVKVTLSLSGPMGKSRTETSKVELRQKNGTWKIYNPSL